MNNSLAFKSNIIEPKSWELSGLNVITSNNITYLVIKSGLHSNDEIKYNSLLISKSPYMLSLLSEMTQLLGGRSLYKMDPLCVELVAKTNSLLSDLK